MARPQKIIRTKRIYRKKSKAKSFFKGLLFVLLILALVGVGFIVSREWSERFGSDAQKPDISDIISAPSGEQSSGVSSVTSEDEEEPIPVSKSEINACYIDFSKLKANENNFDGYFKSLKEEGYNAVYIELKTVDGRVTFKTDNEFVVKYQSMIEGAVDIDSVVAAVLDNSMIPIAKITALRDPYCSHVDNENSFAYLDQLDVNWLDNRYDLGGKSWLNPYMEQARLYISSLSKEASDRGFKMIVLEDVIFPEKNTGKMNPVNPFTTRDKILSQVVAEAQVACGDTPVVRGINAVSEMIRREGDYLSYAESFGDKVAVYVDMESINEHKQIVCEKTKVLTDGQYDPQTKAEAIAEAILSQTKTRDDKTIITIVKAEDKTALSEVITGLSNNSFILK